MMGGRVTNSWEGEPKVSPSLNHGLVQYSTRLRPCFQGSKVKIRLSLRWKHLCFQQIICEQYLLCNVIISAEILRWFSTSLNQYCPGDHYLNTAFVLICPIILSNDRIMCEITATVQVPLVSYPILYDLLTVFHTVKWDGAVWMRCEWQL